ncbi:uncharacterized protein J4E84_006976 [Alternaria hordeiaustralica]|uniref:uncharacterized protein n=1 Tax=Alternaria hordeiaustralica TaxID=1187925 RepID=UPI0020C55FAD|nr:uncharacterized protein J4E84_006976 [Alternaria hordeiaustralica]KAI4683074.1 hypothetical protein J4E84_006976 [Alternaria hordeiaustralica]
MAWNWTPDSKLCFVTTGATAPFTELIESVLSPTCLDSLREGGFTHLLVQYGSAEDVYKQFSKLASAYIQENPSKGTLVIDGIDFNPDGLKTQFQLVQRSKGSGSILEALRYQIPLIVVPNTGLLDNHQEELAVAMERNNYLVRGDVKNLAPAIKKSDDFRLKMSQFPPMTSGKHRETKSFAAIMDETTGYMD